MNSLFAGVGSQASSAAKEAGPNNVVRCLSLFAHPLGGPRGSLTPAPEAEADPWAALVTRRRQLIAMRTSEGRSLLQADVRSARSIRAVIEALEQQIADIDLELQAFDSATIDHPPKLALRLLIADRAQTHVVPYDDIQWLESADNYVNVHARDRALLMRGTLCALVRDLGPGFVRIHRRIVVAVAHVRAIRSRGHGDMTVVLQGGVQLLCSRQHRTELMRRLAG